MPEEAEALAAQLIPTNITEGLGDANWKMRLAACDDMTTWLEGLIEEVDGEVVVRAIAKKGWNEKNFQVCQSMALRLPLLTIYIGFSEALCYSNYAC